MNLELPSQFQNGKWFILCVRHSGCTFCREELFNFNRFESQFLDKGYQPIVVHMGSEESGQDLKRKYGLAHTQFLSDPKKFWFKLFGFKRGNLNQLFGPKNLKKAFLEGSLLKHGIGKLEGDGLQLGGAAVIENGKWRVLHTAQFAGDVGDFPSLLSRLK
jgi:hypothetical protein